MNLTAIINELKSERVAGDDMAQQLVARIDAHIRDLETLKAWVLDSATARSMAIDGMLGGEAPITPIGTQYVPEDANQQQQENAA